MQCFKTTSFCIYRIRIQITSQKSFRNHTGSGQPAEPGQENEPLAASRDRPSRDVFGARDWMSGQTGSEAVELEQRVSMGACILL